MLKLRRVGLERKWVLTSMYSSRYSVCQASLEYPPTGRQQIGRLFPDKSSLMETSRNYASVHSVKGRLHAALRMEQHACSVLANFHLSLA